MSDALNSQTNGLTAKGPRKHRPPKNSQSLCDGDAGHGAESMEMFLHRTYQGLCLMESPAKLVELLPRN